MRVPRRPGSHQGNGRQRALLDVSRIRSADGARVTRPTRRPGRWRAGVLAALLVATGCGTPDDHGASEGDSATPTRPAPTSTATVARPTTTPSAAAPSPTDVGHDRALVLISVDGLNPDALIGGEVSGFATLMNEGAWTSNARTTVEQTHTLPNQASIFTGRSVLGATGTQVTFNRDTGGTLRSVSGAYIPGIFDVAHDHGLTTAFFAEKEKLEFLSRSWDVVNGTPDEVGADNGTGKIDHVRIEPAEVLLPSFLHLLGRPSVPELAFLHIAAPDSAGHAEVFMGETYRRAVRRAGTAIERVLRTISRTPSLRARTTVIVTADHGGRGVGHGDASSLDDYRVPFFVWGKGVQSGADLYGLNGRRRDPGEAQVHYRGRQPIRNLDAAELALELLDLPALDPTASVLRVTPGPQPQR